MHASARSHPGPWIRLAAISIGLILLASLGVLVLVPAPGSATPWTGNEPVPTNLLFHLHNASSGVSVGAVSYLNVMDTVNDTQAPWTGTGARSVATHYDAVDFVAAPELAGPLALNGTVNASVYLNQSGSSPTGGSITLTLYEVAPNGALTLIATGPATGTGSIGSGSSIPTRVFLAGPTVDRTIPEGDSLEVNITIAGNTAEGYGIWWGLVNGTYYISTVSIPASTYLTVPQVTVLNATGAPVVALSESAVNKTVTVIGLVADPLGAYDFEAFPVDFSIVAPNGTVIVGPRPMAPVGGLAAPSAPNASYSTSFNYSGLGPGTYNFTVTATDNTNHDLAGQPTLPLYYGRVASGVATVVVGLPPVPVSVTVVDDHGLPLFGAEVRAIAGGATLAEAATNATGQAAFELPENASYQFAVQWEAVAVGTFTETVTGSNSTFTLPAQVVYPTFAIESAAGQPLPFPLVTVIHPNGTAYPLIVANASGQFTLSQVPVGNFTLTVVYDDSEVVFGEKVYAPNDGPLVVVAENVFTLTVSATSSTGGALSNVFLEIQNRSTGATVASGITDGGGSLTFLVPAGVYVVSGYWASTYDLTSLSESVQTTVNVTGPSHATLDFTKAYPSFFATTMFEVIAVIVVLAAALGIALFLWVRERRRSRRRPPTPLTPVTTANVPDHPEPPPPKSSD